MVAEKRWERRWLRFYKLIACVGAVAVLTPIFEAFCAWPTYVYSPWVALVLSPILFSFGYFIQLLVLGLHRREMRERELDFSYEGAKIRLPHSKVIVACLICAVTSACFSSLIGAWFARMLGPLSLDEVGIPLMTAASAAISVIGCLLVPLRFHQIMSLRTMIELLAVFVLFFGFKVYWTGSIDLLFIVCFLVWSLCFVLLMNQEHIIRPSYLSSTYYATERLRTTGMRAAFRFWVVALVVQLALLGVMSLFVVPFRSLITGGRNFAWVFGFPFESLPILNFLIFFVSVIGLLILIFYWSLHISPAHLRRFSLIMRFHREKIKNNVRALLKRLILLIKNIFKKRAEKLNSNCEKRDRSGEEPKIRNYVDTVSKASGYENIERYDTYHAFYRKLRSLKVRAEKYCFAYRILTWRYCEDDIGVKIYHTPLEVARIVCDKTSVDDFGTLTEIYMDIIYADTDSSSDKDIDRLCEILKHKLK